MVFPIDDNSTVASSLDDGRVKDQTSQVIGTTSLYENGRIHLIPVCYP